MKNNKRLKGEWTKELCVCVSERGRRASGKAFEVEKYFSSFFLQEPCKRRESARLFLDFFPFFLFESRARTLSYLIFFYFLSIFSLSSLSLLQTTKKYSYYAVFDGHGGVDAANYSSAHLHRYLVESEAFSEGRIEEAILEAFQKTDQNYCKRVQEDNDLKSTGTTAVFALIEDQQTCYLAWVGDSQALLVKNGVNQEIMLPHKPGDDSEKKRIQEAGGFIAYLDTWRLNGSLSVSRAIGDPDFKPYICALPGIAKFDITPDLDFLVVGCDGLFDCLTSQDISNHVYEFLCLNENSDTVMQDISSHLSQMAIREGSNDNITSIVLFFKPIEQLVSTGLNASPSSTEAENSNTVRNALNNSNSSDTYFTANNFSGSSLISNYQNADEQMHSMVLDPGSLKNGHFPYTDFSHLPIGARFNLEQAIEQNDRLNDDRTSPINDNNSHLIDYSPKAPSAPGSDSAVQIDSSPEEDDDDDDDDDEEDRKDVRSSVPAVPEVEDVSTSDDEEEFMHYMPGSKYTTGEFLIFSYFHSFSSFSIPVLSLKGLFCCFFNFFLSCHVIC